MKVDFDEYADQYESLLKSQLSFFSGERSYFSEYKVKILKKYSTKEPKSILDFGAGIGLTLPHLLRHFPQSRVSATDISKASLTHISKNYPTVSVIADDSLEGNKFDLILLFTVLHHVEVGLRNSLMRRVEGLLAPGGRICIFEHNPYNPVTQRMVSTCPFDEDAVLLSKSESVDLIRNNTNLRITQSGYTLFFPNSLRALRQVEPMLTWLPLGGQYYVIGGEKPRI